MPAVNAFRVEHPGFYIREEMDAREWTQVDLAFILGIPSSAVNQVLNGRRSVTPDLAKALGDAFDVSPELFLNLQQSYDLARAKAPSPAVAIRGKMQSIYPVREMIKRGWIHNGAPDELENQLASFFGVASTAEIPYMAHAAKKSNYEVREVPPTQLAWLFRVRQLANEISVPTYSEKALTNALTDLQALLNRPEDARHVPKILSSCGVKLIFVEKLPGAKIDGACFWINAQPVIGMSFLHDRIDNFWFVLRHEIEHVLRGDGKDHEIVDSDLDESQTSAVLPPEEIAANEAALEFCVPQARLDGFMKRKHPFYYEKDVVAFAGIVGRHPGIVVGQMRKRLDNYKYLTRYLEKVRSYVVPNAIADGWGQTLNLGA